MSILIKDIQLIEHILLRCLSISELHNIRKRERKCVLILLIIAPFWTSKFLLTCQSVKETTKANCHLEGKKKIKNCCIYSFCCVKISLNFSPVCWVPNLPGSHLGQWSQTGACAFFGTLRQAATGRLGCFSCQLPLAQPCSSSSTQAHRRGLQSDSPIY